jgi:general secretion pathway protein I
MTRDVRHGRRPVIAPGVAGPTAGCAAGRDEWVRRAGGFTLLEVLAAIALLAIAFAIGLSTLGTATGNAARSAALATATERAQSLLDGRGLDAPLRAGRIRGQFGDGRHWTIDITRLAALAPAGRGATLAQPAAVDLYRLDLALQYGDGRTLRLSTLRAQVAPQRP